MKKIITLLLVFILTLGLFACTNKDDPTSQYPSMSKLNIYSQYRPENGNNFFSFNFKWEIEGDYKATFTDEYDLYYSMDEKGPYELCEPKSDFNQTPIEYTLSPTTRHDLLINVTDKYNNLPAGYYRFVFKFNVSKDGDNPEIYQASVDFDLNE